MSYYSRNARALADQYNGLSADEVHASWRHLLPRQPGLAADVGAGSGRDANWLAELGWDVVAVEPEDAFRELAIPTAHPAVSWLKDSLPRLKALRDTDTRFNLILLSAVWMHLSPRQRKLAFRVLSDLLAPGGLLVISVRQEPDAEVRESRGFYEVSTEELPDLAKSRALVQLDRNRSKDALGREQVSWETFCFRLPDDGTGSLPLLRHIIVNDNKSASYKLGLLRTLIRIADGAPGLVAARTEDWVEIPLGAVGLYWLKVYAPALLEHDLPQHPNRRVGYGFAGKDFERLRDESRFDLRLGSRLSGELASTITGAIKKACSNIVEMPAHYTTYPGSQETVFQAEVSTVRRSSRSIELDQNFLSRFGVFRVPVSLWVSMGQYACWLEPAIVNEWVKLMQGWDEKRIGTQRDVSHYLKGLEWRQDKRDTTLVRNQFSSLVSTGAEIRCTWSGKRLKENGFVIDHCFPWSRWFNNDLWNLMPATSAANASKGDKLPSAELLVASRDRIVDWWSSAFSDSDLERRFHCEAQAALPMLTKSSFDLGDVFAAMMLQRKKLKANQQLAEWNGVGR